MPDTPRSAEDLHLWVREHIALPDTRRNELMRAVRSVLDHQRQRLEESKDEAVQALSQAFTQRLARLHTELMAKEATVSSVSRYFEELVAELTEKTHRDPKTKLMNFDWFMERLETFLAVEQRVRWSAIGVVDIRAFKWFNDNLGHAVGDQIIERVAQILSVQIRSVDLLAKERPGSEDLHARFGGDEFCFLIPDLPTSDKGLEIASRFKAAVESYDWHRVHPRLVERPVRVDVGVVSLLLGPVAARRRAARALAGELIQWADRLMYGAKDTGASHVYPVRAEIRDGELVRVDDEPGAQVRVNG
ncbi:MAG: GGDEF domain-containing protein [Vicinamibacterales bacterium]